MRKKSMTNTESNAKKIPPWAWAVSGLLVGLVAAWIAVGYITAIGQPTSASQSTDGQSAAQANLSAGAAPQPQANVAANQQLAQEQAAYARLESANATVANEAVNNNEVSQMMGLMGKTLADYYGEVRNAQDISQTSGCVWGTQCEVSFWAAFAQQALGENSLTTSFDQQAEATYYSHTNSYTYADAKKQLDELVFASYGADVQSTDSDAIKVNKILDFIDSHVHYEYDMLETPQAPAETLDYRSGDCKDFSILASAAFADAGITSGIIHMENATGSAAHAMVVIQSSENLPFDYYSNLTQYGLSAGKWWVIEPQFTFTEQSQNPKWFAGWGITKAAMVSGGVVPSAALEQKTSPAPQQQQDQDTQRTSDLRNLQNALELYFNAKGAYPTGVSDWSDFASAIAATRIGVTTLPNDPAQGATYGYASNGATYVIGAELENPNNAAMQSSLTSMPSGLSWMIVPQGGQNGTACGTAGLYCAGM
jgi:transglutaminase-like putative cysteine protease